MASRSIICRSRRLRQIIDLRDTDKSRYFAITEFNICFISRSPSLFSYFNHFLTAQGSDLPFFSRERGSITHEQNIICSKTRLDGTTHEQTITCSQLFAGHVVGSRPMERKKKMHRMIIQTNCNTIQIWSWCSRYLSSVGKRISGDIRSFVRGKKKWSEKMSTERFKMLRVLLSICWIIKQLSCSISRNIVWF